MLDSLTAKLDRGTRFPYVPCVFLTSDFSSEIQRKINHPAFSEHFCASGVSNDKGIKIASKKLAQIMTLNLKTKSKNCSRPFWLIFFQSVIKVITFCNPRNRPCEHKTSRNTPRWVCPVDFDDRKAMLSLSLKTVVLCGP